MFERHKEIFVELLLLATGLVFQPFALLDRIVLLCVGRRDLLTLGVSTRGALALCKAAKALALARDRDYCLPDDIKELAPVVLSHRVMLNRGQGFKGRSSEHAERVVQDILETVPIPL